MHQRSEKVTLTRFTKGEKLLSEPNPSRRCLCFHRTAASGAAGYGERGRGEQQETPGQQPSLFFYFLSIPLLHGSPLTPEGCAALRRSRCINSPLQRPQVCISAASACFTIPAELLSGKENALPFSLKAIWLGGCPRSAARWTHAMSIINCFHLPFSYSRWMSMY